MRGWCRGGGPEEGIVVGEEGEENSEEEGCGCLGWWGGGQRGLVRGLRGRGWGGLVRQRIMKVAKDWERFPIAMLRKFVSVVCLKLKGLRPEFIPKPAKLYVCGEKLRFGVSSRLLFEYEE